MTDRFAVLLQTRAPDGMTAALFGAPAEPKTVAYLIKSSDGGETWHPVEFKKEEDVQALAAALNQIATESAVAALRYELEDGKS